eukprot:scaffold34769_cov33-Tisochrysis_lutea.AAC.2
MDLAPKKIGVRVWRRCRFLVVMGNLCEISSSALSLRKKWVGTRGRDRSKSCHPHGGAQRRDEACQQVLSKALHLHAEHDP